MNAAPDVRDTAFDDAQLADVLARTWGTGTGWKARLATVDHKIIGRRYILTAFAFLGLGGLLAMAIRIQLARPESGVISPDVYDQIFTTHGANMMFLFAVPVMEAFGVYLVPLMVGTRNIALPRLNAFSYWVYLAGGVFLWASFVLNAGPDVGWFAYPPLSGPEYGNGHRPDVLAQMITFTEVSAMAVATEIIVTAFKQRAPGMRLDRIPLFVWSMVVTAFMVLFAMPSIMIGSTALILDRLVNTHFFDTAKGGDVLAWQHLFWFFGHPEVYIIFLPATGMVSTIIETFARRPMFGRTAVVLSLIATGFLAFGLWVHHMFATGLPQLGESFFTASSMLIAVPSGVQVFCWIATLATGRPVLRTPLLFVLAFFATFVLGGMTGVMVAAVPLDLQVHDTYFVVAHFHYVLIGGALFPLLGGVYYWFPKMTGRMLSERIGAWQCALAFVGFNLTFFPMHLLGLLGMPRRVYTYQPELGWAGLNQLATAGALILFASFLLLLWNGIASWRRGAVAGPNPWQAAGLEWATSSPPPPQNFTRIPIVSSTTPLWHAPEPRPSVGGLAVHMRELLVTTFAEARPDLREASPAPSIWPLVSAVALTVLFIGSIFTPWAVVWGSPPLGLAFLLWFWPKHRPEDRR